MACDKPGATAGSLRPCYGSSFHHLRQLALTKPLTSSLDVGCYHLRLLPPLLPGSSSFLSFSPLRLRQSDSPILKLTLFPRQVAFYLPSYTLNLGTAASSTTVVGLINALASIGGIIIGYDSDKSLPWTLSIMSISSGIISFTAWGFASSLGAVFAFACSYALFSAIYSTWGAAARNAAGASSSSRLGGTNADPFSFETGSNPHLGTMIVCLMGVSRGVASIIGPFIGSALYDPTEVTEKCVFRFLPSILPLSTRAEFVTFTNGLLDLFSSSSLLQAQVWSFRLLKGHHLRRHPLPPFCGGRTGARLGAEEQRKEGGEARKGAGEHFCLRAE